MIHVVETHIVEIERLYQYYSTDVNDTQHAPFNLPLHKKDWRRLVSELLPEHHSANADSGSQESNAGETFVKLNEQVTDSIFEMTLHNATEDPNLSSTDISDTHEKITESQFTAALLRLAGFLYPWSYLSTSTRSLLHELMAHSRVDLDAHFNSQLGNVALHHVWDRNVSELREIFQHYSARGSNLGSQPTNADQEEHDEHSGSHGTLMKYQHFWQLIEESSGKKKTLVTSKVLKNLYQNAMLGSVDNGLSYNAFLQLLTAVAHFYMPSPYLSIATRCREFLDDRILPLRKCMEKNASRREKSIASAGSSKKKKKGSRESLHRSL